MDLSFIPANAGEDPADLRDRCGSHELLVSTALQALQTGLPWLQWGTNAAGQTTLQYDDACLVVFPAMHLLESAQNMLFLRHFVGDAALARTAMLVATNIDCTQPMSLAVWLAAVMSEAAVRTAASVTYALWDRRQ